MNAHTAIEERVMEAVSDNLAVALKNLHMADNFFDDLGADSLDVLEVVMSVEDEFEIEIPDEVAEKIRTVQDVVNAVTTQLGR